jgi:uncharacterized membrane protein
MPNPSENTVHGAYNVAFTALSFLGAGLAGTLWWALRNNEDLPCTAGGGCVEVWNSDYAHITIGPIHQMSVALLGLIGYILLFTLGMMKAGADTPAGYRWPAMIGSVVALGGTAYSWYLQYVSHFVIGHFCPWCFTSACLMTMICATAFTELSKLRVRRAASAEMNQTDHA